MPHAAAHFNLDVEDSRCLKYLAHLSCEIEILRVEYTLVGMMPNVELACINHAAKCVRASSGVACLFGWLVLAHIPILGQCVS